MGPKHVPSIPELRAAVAKSEAVYGTIPWVSKKFIHPHVSIYLTRLFLLLGFHGDLVTVLMAFTALVGAATYFLGGTAAYALGGGLMLLSWVLDHSDGEVLRYHNVSSARGIYLDRLTHRLSYPLMYLGTGLSLSRDTAEPGFMLFGAFVALAHQLTVELGLDRKLIAVEWSGVDSNSLKTLRLAVTSRMPLIGGIFRVVVAAYANLIQHTSFILLLVAFSACGLAPSFYRIFGSAIIFHCLLTIGLDLTATFSRAKRR